jgi:hypothetical protein
MLVLAQINHAHYGKQNPARKSDTPRQQQKLHHDASANAAMLCTFAELHKTQHINMFFRLIFSAIELSLCK